MAKKYDVYLNAPDGLHRLEQNVALGKARETANKYSGGYRIDIKQVDGKGYNWQTLIGDRVLKEGLSYTEALDDILHVSETNQGYFLDNKGTQFKIQEQEGYFDMVFSIRDAGK